MGCCNLEQKGKAQHDNDTHWVERIFRAANIINMKRKPKELDPVLLELLPPSAINKWFNQTGKLFFRKNLVVLKAFSKTCTFEILN